MGGIRTPRSIKGAQPLCERFAVIQGEIAAIENDRNAAIVAANKTADAALEPLVAESEQLREKLDISGSRKIDLISGYRSPRTNASLRARGGEHTGVASQSQHMVGKATDIMIHAQETQKLKQRLNEIYVKHTGQTLKKVEAALERDNFMSPEEAKEWGLIDEIVESRPKPDGDDS